MKDNKKFARIMAILLAVLLMLTFIMPAFSMLAYADEPENIQQQKNDAEIPDPFF